MINQSNIAELATREQTTEINIAREYLQHLFLRSLYRKEGADKFLFKGGTAIRIVFNGSRYSEDLDFSIPRMTKKEIEDVLLGALYDLEEEGITKNLEVQDADTTTGGYLANINLDILGFKVGMTSNLQIKDDPAWLVSQPHLIANPLFLPAYTLVTLKDELIVKEKIEALKSRHKPRDVFDAYFFARDPNLRKFLPRDPETMQKISESLDKISDHDLEADLKPFLPRNYQNIIKTLKDSIRTEFGIS